MQPSIRIGDLIQFNEDHGITQYVDDFTPARPKKGEIGIIYEKNKRSTRYKLYTSRGQWAEITNYDIEKGLVIILASKFIPRKKNADFNITSSINS